MGLSNVQVMSALPFVSFADDATMLQIGREVHRSGCSYGSWREFATNAGMSAHEAQRAWSEFEVSDAGPDVICGLASAGGWDGGTSVFRQDPWAALADTGFDYAAEHVISPPKVRTGIEAFDDAFGGIESGTYTVIGGEGGVGKTQLAVNAIVGALADGGTDIRVVYYSVELGEREAWDRILGTWSQSPDSGVRPFRWGDARLMVERRVGGERAAWDAWCASAEERAEMVRAYVDGGADPAVIAYARFRQTLGRRLAVRASVTDISQIEEEVRMLTSDGIRVMPVIDHLHILQDERLGGDASEYQRVSDLSDRLRALAKECRVPMLVMAELRNIGERERDEPRQSWFRGSGRVAYDAGLASVATNDGEAERGMRPVLLTPVKSRHTATEPVRLWFDGANGTFETRE